MHRTHLALILAGLFLGTACTPSALDTDLVAEEQAVREASAAWFATEVRRDLDAALSYLAADAVIQAEGVPTMDKAAMGVYWEEMFFPSPYTNVVLTEPRAIVVAASGDIAYDIGPWAVVFQGEDGRTEVPGKSAIVWRKSDGQWKSVFLSFSFDAPSVASAE